MIFVKFFIVGLMMFLFLQSAHADDGAHLNNEFKLEVGEEGRLDKSLRLIEETLFQLDDLKEIIRYPYDNSENTWYFLGGIGALILVDVPVTKFYQDKIEPIFKNHTIKPPSQFRGVTGILGISGNGPDSYLMLGMSASYILGAGLNDEKMQQAALLAGKASAYSFLISHIVLKSVTARKRPVPNLSSGTGETENLTANPYAFGYYHTPYLAAREYGTSMPSFHFTQYFAIAKVYQKVYDNYLIPYSLMAIGLTSAITAHRHWVSDMVAGAVIGTVIGSVVADGAQEEELPTTIILPVLTSEEVGVSFTYRF